MRTPVTPIAVPIEAYQRRRFPITYAFLDLYRYWWSHKHLRFAAWAAIDAERKGLPPIIELE